MASYLVYDLEIVKGILGKKEERMPGVEYCRGWHDHENMGVSVVCAYVGNLKALGKEGHFRVFCEDNLDEFFDLCEQSDLLVSFNGVNFDNKVLAFHGKMPEGNHYDILREIWVANELNPDKFYWKTHGGFGLDAVCEANGLGCKSGHGALAPVQWQRGEIGAVIDYCLKDVLLTKKLFVMSQAQDTIRSPKGGFMSLRKLG